MLWTWFSKEKTIHTYKWFGTPVKGRIQEAGVAVVQCVILLRGFFSGASWVLPYVTLYRFQLKGKKRLCEFATKAGGRRDAGSQNKEFTLWRSAVAVHTTYRNISRVTWRVLRHQTKFTTEFKYLVFTVNFITDQQTRLCDFHSQTFATPNLDHLLSVCLTDRQTMTTRIPLRRQCLNHQTKRIRIHYF